MTDKTEFNDELRPEYDETLLKDGIRGKYAAGTNIIRLDPDVAADFPTEEAVGMSLPVHPNRHINYFVKTYY